MTFKTNDELKNYILKQSQFAIMQVQAKVFQVIQKFVKQYYTEFSPEVYERTYQLFQSLVKSDVKLTDNGWVAEVYFDLDKLDYQIKKLTKWPTQGGYMNPFNGKISSSGWFPNPKGSAEKTMEAAAHGSHGGKESGTAIWDESLNILNRDAINMLKEALINNGIPVKK